MNRLFFIKLLSANLFFCFCLKIVFAQSNEREAISKKSTLEFSKKTDNNPYKINWLPIRTLSVDEESRTVNVFYFEDAFNDAEKSFLPVYHHSIKVDKNKKYTASLINSVYESISESNVSNITGLNEIETELKITTTISSFQKQNWLDISFVPLRKNLKNGQLERLVSFDISLTETGSAYRTSNTNRLYTSQSVLSNGDWHKVGVATSGIYRLTYKFLDSIGVDVKNLNPRNIKLYGNGGGMLPYLNSTPRKDDLTENAIYVSGESDGKFDSTDYVLFYGQGPHKWVPNSSSSCPSRKFRHEINIFSDSTFYFLTTNQGYGKRIQVQASNSASPTYTTSTFLDMQYHERDLRNFVNSGREFYGEEFDAITTYTFNFSMPNIDLTNSASVFSNVVARYISSAAGAGTTFDIATNGNSIGTVKVPAIPQSNTQYLSEYVKPADFCNSFTPTSSSLQLSFKYNKNGNSFGYLNYVEVFAKRNLYIDKNQFLFKATDSIRSGSVTEFNISNANPNSVIWDITDATTPFIQQAPLTNTNLVFRSSTESIRDYIVYNGLSYLQPSYKGKVANQNLHGITSADFVIVAHPKFYKDALELGALHREKDTLTTVVVTTNEIYNEFSGGAKDITAIKDFMKMLYDKNSGTLLPKYLLLYGDASYNRILNPQLNTDYVPTYESANSYFPLSTYVSDDYFGLLDDSESDLESDKVDIGIGRFPVKTDAESKAILNKIKTYINPTSSQGSSSSAINCNSDLGSSAYGLSDWRNNVTFVADDEDGNAHLSDAETIAGMVNTSNKEYNIDKIYLDSYVQVSTAGGQLYPEVNEAINKKMDKGCLIINYSGHGGETGWTGERILDNSMIGSWQNINRMPFFVTATCEFSRFDDPARNSAGENVLLNPKGGGIGLLTTTRVVFANSNLQLNVEFYNNVFKQYNGRAPRLGDIMAVVKKNVPGGSYANNRKFCLLGDPALTLAYPKQKLKTNTINSKVIITGSTNTVDTVRALSKMSVSGSVVDASGNKITNYNGIIYPTIYDKASTISTLSNDAASPKIPFQLQKNVVFKGKATVTNGDFSFECIIPKDIAYNYGKGKISYYFENGKQDGSGYEDRFIIGGYNVNAVIDNNGPEVKIYMNDEKFVSGGLTNETPIIFAKLFDENGINTIGTGIGHDITAIVDEKADKALVLNDYYESELNNYKKGQVRYKLSSLTEGQHTMRLKAWDVYNNSSETAIDFVVASSTKLALQHVLNYPNPFTTKTAFYFEHNKPCMHLDVQLQVFTVSGKLVKSLDITTLCDGNRSSPIDWDGKDDYGDQLSKGVYVYRLKVRSADGDEAEKFEKLVILK